jgi:uncharacterized protein (TIRG00374 family)
VQQSSIRLTILIAAGIAVAVACLVWVLRDIELWQLRESIASSQFAFIPPVVVLALLFYRLKAIRWALLLAPQFKTTGRALFPAVMIGYAGNTLVPLQFGDLLRARMVAEREHASTTTVLASIGLERILDMLGLMLPVALAAFVVHSVPPTIYGVVVAVTIATLALLLATCFAVFATARCLAIVRWSGQMLPQRFATTLFEQVRAGIDGLTALRQGRLLSRAIACSVAHWLILATVVWLCLLATHVAVAPVAALLVTLLLVISTNLPNSPGFIGSIQLAFVLALEPFGVAAESALAASIFFHLTIYPTTVLVGLIYIIKAGQATRAALSNIARFGARGSSLAPP